MPVNRTITHFFRPRPQRQVPDDEIYDNIVVGGSPGSSNPPSATSNPTTRSPPPTASPPPRTWPSSARPGKKPRSQKTEEGTAASTRHGLTTLTTDNVTTDAVAGDDAANTNAAHIDGTASMDDLPESGSQHRFRRGKPADRSSTPDPASLPEPSVQTSPLPVPNPSSFPSFTSTSSLATRPSSSQRVMVGGVQAVTGSDSEDDDMEEVHYAVPVSSAPFGIEEGEDEDEDEDEFEDLSAIYSKPKPQPDAQQTASSVVGGHALRTRVSPQQKKKPERSAYNQSGKYSLASLVKIADKAGAADEQLAATREKLDIAEQEAIKRQGDSPADDAIDGGELLAAVVGDDQDEAQGLRLLQAMDRTGALHQEPVWHFFTGAPQALERSPFPSSACHGWTALLKERSQREDSFRTGFAASMASVRSPPNEIVGWILEEIHAESQDDLCQAYFYTLLATKSQVNTLLRKETIDRLLLQHLGVKKDVLDCSHVIIPHIEKVDSPERVPPIGLRWFIEIINAIADYLSPDLWVHVAHFMIKMSIDETVSRSGEIQTLLDKAIVTLIDRAPQDGNYMHELSQAIFHTVQHPFLKYRLINALPATSPPTHAFRRRLALSFFLFDDTILPPSVALISPSFFSRVLDQLRTHPLFKITSRTDSLALRASLACLDLAVDSGFSDLPFLTADAAIGQDATAQQSRRTQELAFNEDIEVLARAIRWVDEQIIDTGAANLHRTLAKETARRLVARLQHAVRTKEKRRVDLFSRGTDAGEAAAASTFMQSWFTKTKKSKVAETSTKNTEAG